MSAARRSHLSTWPQHTRICMWTLAACSRTCHGMSRHATGLPAFTSAAAATLFAHAL
jgi:hypothetical protein